MWLFIVVRCALSHTIEIILWDKTITQLDIRRSLPTGPITFKKSAFTL
jgi:hypothetical protein